MSRRRREWAPSTAQILAWLISRIGLETFRDLVCICVGAAGTIHEVLAMGTERPELLILLGSLMFLPLPLRADSWRKRILRGRYGSTEPPERRRPPDDDRRGSA